MKLKSGILFASLCFFCSFFIACQKNEELIPTTNTTDNQSSSEIPSIRADNATVSTGHTVTVDAASLAINNLIVKK